MTSTITGVEHAPTTLVGPVRDQIVLSAAEVANAYKTAIRTPQLAVTFLADCAEHGITVAARTRARYELAAQVVIDEGLFPVYDEPSEVLDLDKPEPTVSHTTTFRTRVPSPVVQRDPEGNRFVEAADARGGFRVSLVEREDGVDVPPVVLADVDSEYSERDFAILVEHLIHLRAEIDPTGDLRAHAAKAVDK